jgi:hypothetical protein
MARVMPSQVVQTIDELFPHAAKNAPGAVLMAQHGSQLLGIMKLVKDVPDELIMLTAADYSELILAESTIEEHLAHWRARGDIGEMARVKGVDAASVAWMSAATSGIPPNPACRCAHAGYLLEDYH